MHFYSPSTPLDLSALAGDSFLFEGSNGAILEVTAERVGLFGPNASEAGPALLVRGTVATDDAEIIAVCADSSDNIGIYSFLPGSANLATTDVSGLKAGLDINIGSGRVKVFYDPLGDNESNYLWVGEGSVNLVSTDTVTGDEASLYVEPLAIWAEVDTGAFAITPTSASLSVGDEADNSTLEVTQENTLIRGQKTITGTLADGYSLRADPGYSAATAQTVTRHNYLDLQNVSNAGAGPSAVTDACLARFDAAAGTHKAVDSSSTKTTPGGVDAWVKININGTIHYMPAYTSKTA